MNRNFLFTVIFAFASVISFFTVNSYFADSHHMNGVFIGAGVVFALLAIFFLSKTAK